MFGGIHANEVLAKGGSDGDQSDDLKLFEDPSTQLLNNNNTTTNKLVTKNEDYKLLSADNEAQALEKLSP